MKIKPLGNRIIIRPEKVEERTAGGIYIPDSAQQKSKRAEVVAISDTLEVALSVGDKVIVETFAGSEVEIDNESYRIVNAKDILAKIE